MTDLFRPEVRHRSKDRLPGTISLMIPVSWNLVIAAITSCVVAIGIFLAIAQFNQTELAAGEIQPAGGFAEIKPSRVGRIEEIRVSEGAVVGAGDILVRIRVAEDDDAVGATQNQAINAVSTQSRALEAQEDESRSASNFEQAEFAARQRGLQSELSIVESQISLQEQLVTLARTELEQVRKVAARGFISRRDLSAREEFLLSRIQGLQSLQADRVAKRSELSRLQVSGQQAASRSAADLSALRSVRAQVARDSVNAALQNAYTLTAPTAGRVTGINAFVGRVVTGSDRLMIVSPVAGKLQVRLEIPERAIRSIRVGQQVNIALDAYPYDRFGTILGHIEELSATPVATSSDKAGGNSSYLATVSLPAGSLMARGRKYPLRIGMHVSARVIIERRSLLSWLLKPSAIS